MKHKIYSLVAMLTMALALTSCFKEEEKVPDNSSQHQHPEQSDPGQ